jgi:CO dehydrogenase nickel-insertion accessory protein CooC1
VDLMVMVADPSRRGLDTVERLHRLTVEMGIEYSRLAIAVNRLRRDQLPAGADALREATGADLVLALPQDDAVADLAEGGRPLSELPADNPAARRIEPLLDLVAQD